MSKYVIGDRLWEFLIATLDAAQTLEGTSESVQGIYASWDAEIKDVSPSEDREKDLKLLKKSLKMYAKSEAKEAVYEGEDSAVLREAVKFINDYSDALAELTLIRLSLGRPLESTVSL